LVLRIPVGRRKRTTSYDLASDESAKERGGKRNTSFNQLPVSKKKGKGA